MNSNDETEAGRMVSAQKEGVNLKEKQTRVLSSVDMPVAETSCVTRSWKVDDASNLAQICRKQPGAIGDAGSRKGNNEQSRKEHKNQYGHRSHRSTPTPSKAMVLEY